MNQTHSQNEMSASEYVQRLNACLDAGVQIVWKMKWEGPNAWNQWDGDVSRPGVEGLDKCNFLALLPGTSFDEWKANGCPIDVDIPDWMG